MQGGVVLFTDRLFMVAQPLSSFLAFFLFASLSFSLFLAHFQLCARPVFEKQRKGLCPRGPRGEGASIVANYSGVSARSVPVACGLAVGDQRRAPTTSGPLQQLLVFTADQQRALCIHRLFAQPVLLSLSAYCLFYSVLSNLQQPRLCHGNTLLCGVMETSSDQLCSGCIEMVVQSYVTMRKPSGKNESLNINSKG